MKAPEQARKDASPRMNVTSKSPVGDTSVVTLISTDTTLYHCQKAKEVCLAQSGGRQHMMLRQQLVLLVSSVYGMADNASHTPTSEVCSAVVGGSSQADHLKRKYAMDDSIGGS